MGKSAAANSPVEKIAQNSRRDFVGDIVSAAGASLFSLPTKAAAKDSLPLAVPGKQPYSIFLSPEASPSERWAAQELRSHIEQMTGIRLPVERAANAPASPRIIAIGKSALTERLGIDPPPGETCVLRTVGETVVVAGGRQRGTMYGVSLLLEKLGCRWFTTDVARIPRIEALSIAPMNETHRPGFDYREVFFTEAQGREWSARNRLNGNFHRLDESTGGKIAYMPWAHSFYALMPPDRYFASHPEYFAFVDGQRQSSGAQLCLTNADVLRLSVEQVRRWLAEHPDVSIVSVSQNDTGGWCECSPCRQAIREEGGAISGLALRFVNQVAEQIAASHPGKTIDMLAYRETADSPPNISTTARPRANVQIRLCPIDACQAHSYKSCVYNRGFHRRLEQWSRIAPRLLIWQYSINFSHYLAPFPNYDSLISDIPLFHRAGISGLFIQGAVSEGGGGDDAELRSYLAARLLWNPLLDPTAEIRDFLDAVYGPASSIMWGYFTLRQQGVRHGQHLWVDQNVFDQQDSRTSGFLTGGRALLDQASELAATEAARRRVERHLLSIDYLEAIRGKRCVIQENAQGREYGPADPSRVQEKTRDLIATAKALGITNLREDYPIDRQVQDWGDVGAHYGAVVIASNTAAATVIPELGRVITFERLAGRGPAPQALTAGGGAGLRPAASNLLRVPDPGEWAYPHAGGIFVSVSDGESGFQLYPWRLESSTPEGVALTSATDSGRVLAMEVGIKESTIHLHVTVSNPGPTRARVAILCRAELSCNSSHGARLTYKDQSGSQHMNELGPTESRLDGNATFAGPALPQQEWTLASQHPPVHFMNRFQAGEVARCSASWTFRGVALSIKMSVLSPEVELAQGQQLSLTSEYDSSLHPSHR